MGRPEVIVLALLIAPVPLVVMVALLRGYSIHLSLKREGRRNDD